MDKIRKVRNKQTDPYLLKLNMEMYAPIADKDAEKPRETLKLNYKEKEDE